MEFYAAAEAFQRALNTTDRGRPQDRLLRPNLLINLATAYRYQAGPASALADKIYQEAIDELASSGRANTALMALFLHNRAMFKAERGDRTSALAHMQEMMAIWDANPGYATADRASTLEDYASLLAAEDHPDAAQRLRRIAQEIRSQLA